MTLIYTKGKEFNLAQKQFGSQGMSGHGKPGFYYYRYMYVLSVLAGSPAFRQASRRHITLREYPPVNTNHMTAKSLTSHSFYSFTSIIHSPSPGCYPIIDALAMICTTQLMFVLFNQQYKYIKGAWFNTCNF